MSKKHGVFFNAIKRFWFFLIIGVVLIIFLFNREIAIWFTIIFLIVLILLYLPSLSFKSRLIRFMNKHTTIEDKTVALNFELPLEYIKEKMNKLYKNQKRKNWLIIFSTDRYIFLREDTIRKFKELYYNGYNEKQIFENLKKDINIRTRAEIKVIIDTLNNLNKLKDIKKLKEKPVAKTEKAPKPKKLPKPKKAPKLKKLPKPKKAPKPKKLPKPKKAPKPKKLLKLKEVYRESHEIEKEQQIERVHLVKPKIPDAPKVVKKPIDPIEIATLVKPKVPKAKKPIKSINIDAKQQSTYDKVDLDQYIKKISVNLEDQKQNEITVTSDLLDDNGELIQRGWSRKPILNYNREKIKAGPLRIKEWDYYAILNHDGHYGITITVADLGFAGLIAVVWLDFKEKTFISDDVMVLFTKGKFNLPRTSETGEIVLTVKGVTLNIKRKSDKHQLNLYFPRFNKGEGIKVELTLTQDPKMDSMVIATPWKNNPTRFYYNQKINCMPANGIVQKGKEIFYFKGDSDKSYGVLDWGRGVWPRKNRWYWGSASGKLDNGALIGWNIGYGFSDRSYASENLIFYNGVGHKLNQVLFHIDTKNYMKPWRFTSNDGRFEMIMEPIIDRNSKVNLLLLKSLQHQIFGYFTGYLTLDDGTKIKINNLLGFAEDVYNKW